MALEEGESMSVGYGADGGDPFNFCLEAGQQASTGFITVFASSNYADMKYLVQRSPFRSESTDADARGPNSIEKPMKQWESRVGTITVAETQ